VNHAADLIRQAFIRQKRPEKATKFANLYSRLLSQPVLSQKWAILYFLYQVSDSAGADAIRRQIDGLGMQLHSPDVNGPGSPDKVDSMTPVQRERAVDIAEIQSHNGASPTFNDAFSRNGLARLREDRIPQRDKPPPSRDRDKAPPRPSPTTKAQEMPSPEVQTPQTTNVAAPAEAALLRDLPFTLQGLSSTNLSFSNTKSLKLPSNLPVPILSLLHALAEPSLLYKGLAEFVDSSEGGLVGQSLRSAIGQELRSYLGLVATLEGQIRRALAQLDESSNGQGLGKAGVTLKRCVVWTREATMGLRLMSVIVEDSRGMSKLAFRHSTC